MVSSNNYWVIWCSFIVALLLQTMPWFSNLLFLKPNWILLILFYWIIELPHQINISTACIAGLILDLISGSTLGIHILPVISISYLIVIKYRTFYITTLWGQSLLIMWLSFLVDIFISLEEFLLIHFYPKWEICFSDVANGILWPWIILLMRKVRQYFNLY